MIDPDLELFPEHPLIDIWYVTTSPNCSFYLWIIQSKTKTLEKKHPTFLLKHAIVIYFIKFLKWPIEVQTSWLIKFGNNGPDVLLLNTGNYVHLGLNVQSDASCSNYNC